MNKFALILASFALLLSLAHSKTTCGSWDSKAGAHFDVRKLTLPSTSKDKYDKIDGDIPCTPETEPSYGYVWNICGMVPTAAIPSQCGVKNSAVLQWAQYGKDVYCYSLAGDYRGPSMSLLDIKNPAKGVSVNYAAGDQCPNGLLRSANIEIQCANTDYEVVSVQEPSTCAYSITMNSYYGCPTECGVTKNGLCDSHGHCSYDTVNKVSYCYCNEGYSGSSCSTKTTEEAGYDGFSVQLGLLVTLLLIALGLTGGIFYMSYQIAEFRKEQIGSHYKSLPGGENEMVETVNFR